jgi:endonuclease III
VWSASTTTEKKLSKAFKEAVEEVLPCRPMMLPVSKFKWKFENPQNAPCKKIANEAGFEALVDVVMAKQTTDNVVVWL